MKAGEAAPQVAYSPAGGSATWRGWVLWGSVIGGLVALRWGLDVAAGFDLHFDEAQYWTWSLQLDWSYYSKGPLVAWLMALSTGALGHGEWQVRLPAWLAFGGFVALLSGLARDVVAPEAKARVGVWAACLGVTTPLFFGLGQVMTTDVWLLGAWTAALWGFFRALHRDDPRGWFVAGVAVGVGFLAKSTVLLLPAAVGVGLLATAMGRRKLAHPMPWLGAGVALLLALPVLYWNASHDWLMVRHQGGHVAPAGLSLAQWGEWLGGQVGLLSPVVVGLAVWVLGRPP
ncbi:MAG: glycosyltransferase family 39 protein, partial [Candidatus Competibacterales bacterium]